MFKAGSDILAFGSKISCVFFIMLGCLYYLEALPHYVELSSHFRLQYYILSLIVTLVFILHQDWKWFFFGLVAVGLNGVGLFPWHLASPALSEASDITTLRFLHSNVLSTNTKYSKLMALVSEENPEIIMLQETNEAWLEALEPLKKSYPYFHATPRSDDPGIALYSRIPLSKAEILHIGDPGAPSIFSQFEFRDRQISLLTTHLSSPRVGSNFQARNVQLKALARFTETIPGPAIIMGDLNVTMWSPYYRMFVKDSGLVSVRDGLGLFPTWPTLLPFMMIPIDHGFITEGLRVVKVKTGRNIGSDHLPLVVDIAL